MTILPAYGRDYKNKAEIQAALDADKDFLTSELNSQLINKSQLLELGHTSVVVRYGNQRKTALLKIR